MKRGVYVFSVKDDLTWNNMNTTYKWTQTDTNHINDQFCHCSPGVYCSCKFLYVINYAELSMGARWYLWHSQYFFQCDFLYFHGYIACLKHVWSVSIKASNYAQEYCKLNWNKSGWWQVLNLNLFIFTSYFGDFWSRRNLFVDYIFSCYLKW